MTQPAATVRVKKAVSIPSTYTMTQPAATVDSKKFVSIPSAYTMTQPAATVGFKKAVSIPSSMCNRVDSIPDSRRRLQRQRDITMETKDQARRIPFHLLYHSPPTSSSVLSHALHIWTSSRFPIKSSSPVCQPANRLSLPEEAVEAR